MMRKYFTIARRRMKMGRKSKEQIQREKSNKYIAGWVKENQRRFNIAFNANSDADLIRFLESMPNKSDYIRKLILADIRKSLGEQ